RRRTHVYDERFWLGAKDIGGLVSRDRQESDIDVRKVLGPIERCDRQRSFAGFDSSSGVAAEQLQVGEWQGARADQVHDLTTDRPSSTDHRNSGLAADQRAHAPGCKLSIRSRTVRPMALHPTTRT